MTLYDASDCSFPSIYFLEHRFFFMYTTFCNFLYITGWHIYNKYNQTVVSIHTGNLTYNQTVVSIHTGYLTYNQTVVSIHTGFLTYVCTSEIGMDRNYSLIVSVVYMSNMNTKPRGGVVCTDRLTEQHEHQTQGRGSVHRETQSKIYTKPSRGVVCTDSQGNMNTKLRGGVLCTDRLTEHHQHQTQGRGIVYRQTHRATWTPNPGEG